MNLILIHNIAWDASKGMKASPVMNSDGILALPGLHVDQIEIIEGFDHVRTIYPATVDHEPRNVQEARQFWTGLINKHDKDLDFHEASEIATSYAMTLCCGLQSFDQRCESAHVQRSEFAAMVLRYCDEDASLVPHLRKLAGACDGMKYERAAYEMGIQRALATTRNGRKLLVPRFAQPGDILCVLWGGRVPYILRSKGEQYRLVGECYLHGAMDGELVEAWSEHKVSGITESIFRLS